MQYNTDGRDKILIFLDGDHLTHRMHCNEKRIGKIFIVKKSPLFPLLYHLTI